ncbi:ExeA family protein [Cellvibrio polysaccharolyticus]|uniref:AAA family ATPase n=1 Tax=Cellvibrio polysaccharolyticus TaxID=2082724 RepID=A0A928YWY9_9GAMM|nr:AAA family ATPase [Cellvibrio polysaccharolyticus]MBE8718753.1 AAA family ATPase [Cellvibrio polysaccharolyticus]
MYQEFFGLQEKAFSIAVNPRYLYMSDQHREALAHLLYGIQVGGFVMLTGEVGTGKTTIIRCLLEQLPEDTDIAIILNPMASAPELLSTICDELGIEHNHKTDSVKSLVDALYRYLLDSHERGRKTVLLIDEAQLLHPKVLEQIRLLTNLETTTEKLLQIILVGQPELKKMLERASLRQLSQRITARFHLEALSLEETSAYIAHRLQVAGLRDNRNPFTPALVRRVHESSGGIPRLINVICERMLLGAYGKNTHTIDDEVFRLAAAEVSGKPVEIFSRPEKSLQLAPIAVAALLGLATVGAIGFFAWQPAPQTSVPASSSPVESSSAVVSSQAFSSHSASAVAIETATALTRYYNEADQAFAQLVSFNGIASREHTYNGCIAEGGYVCERVRLQTWNDLREINRPLVMTLVTADRKQVYVTLVGLSDDQALLHDETGAFVVPWSQLAQLWNGQVNYVWQRPPAYERAVVPGERSLTVRWLALQFAQLDGQEQPLTRDTFTPVLKKRVEMFQAKQGLHADGIAGAQTLRKLNEVLGFDKTLLTDEEAFAAVLMADEEQH